MNKDSILELIYYIISILIIFILKYLNEQIRRVFTEKSEKLRVLNGDDKTMYCIMNTKNCCFRMYPNSIMFFRFSGIVELKGPLDSSQTIIFFDDIFQIKYKTYILNKCREQEMN